MTPNQNTQTALPASLRVSALLFGIAAVVATMLPLLQAAAGVIA